jgi:AcrR family transcriptional regulator
MTAQGTGKRERNKAENRTAILTAARRVFLDHGYDAVTVRDIIRETDLAAGTFYNYFPDKASVFTALVQERMTDLNSRLHDVRSRARTLGEFLHHAYLTVFQSIADDPLFYEMVLRNEPVVRNLYEDSVFGISMAALQADIRDAMKRGIMPLTDVEYLAAAFYGVGYEMGRSLVRREHRDPERAAKLATALLLRGVDALHGVG